VKPGAYEVGMFPTSLYPLVLYYPECVFLSMDYSNMWWNDAIEIPLMAKHVQIIKHFEKRYKVEVNREMTFAESKFISDAITKIKFLKVRKLIDNDKLCTLFKLISSNDEESRELGTVLLKQLHKKTKA
jgi:hypothetical protein